MTSTAISEAMRDGALAIAAEIIRFAQTAAENYPDGYDLSLAVMRGTDPLTYREMLDAVILLEAHGLAKLRLPDFCTLYAVKSHRG
jgi:hypothetical protein